MDDKSPNSSASQSNIDDLVKELSRPQGSAPSPASPVPPSIPNTLPRPTPVSPAPVMPSRPMTLPPVVSNSIPVAPKTSLPPVVQAVPTTPTAPKEYQSSIRTMSDDLAKLKAGQQPQGVNTPRKIDNTPVPAKPVVPAIPAPAPAGSKPIISMPSATKSAPLPTAPSQKPVIPVPAPIPRPVMPTMPPANKVPAAKLDQKNQFYVPPADTKAAGSVPSSGSRNLIFVGIAIAAVLLGGLYWYFMIQGSSTPVAVESPIVTFTPLPTATPNPDVLSTIFTTHGGAIVLPSAGDPVTAFSNAVAAQPNITSGTFTVIDIASGASTSAQPLTISGLLNRFVVSYPPALQTALGQNYKFLLYGQKESFDSKGKPITNVVAGSRLVMVSEIASSSTSILQGWESTMSSDLAGVVGINKAKNTNGAFLDSLHQGVVIRYKNFLYPDSGLGYCIVKNPNGKSYLVIASSRESVYSAIDKLLGF